MEIKVKLAIKDLSERGAFDEIAGNRTVKSKLSYDRGVWATITGPRNFTLMLLCDLCNAGLVDDE